MNAAEALAQCQHNLGYHRPQLQETQDRMENIRTGARELANIIASNTDYNRETQMAYTHLEECVMSAIAGLARHEKDASYNA
jgi:hypothetical protein